MSGEIGRQKFREVMGNFATGVAVVTGVDPRGNPLGFTANAVTSVSLDPLLVLVAVDRDSTSLPALLESGSFALSFLRARDRGLALRFARSERDARFQGLALREDVTGAPILEQALAWVDCSIWKSVEAGDHLVVFGEVAGCGTQGHEDPLIFFQGRYGTISP